MDGHVEGLEEGRAEGEARERANILQRLLDNGMPEEEAKRILGIE